MGRTCAYGESYRRWWSAAILVVVLSISSSDMLAQNGRKTNLDQVSEFPASELNAKLPEWAQLGGEYRMRFEDHTAYKFASGADDAFVLSRLRFHLSLNPKPWFSVLLQAQDAHGLGIDSKYVTSSINDALDFRQGYLQIVPVSWMRLRAGRQELRFGGQRLVGVSDWSNTGRVFDGFRMTVGSEKEYVDLVATSVVVNYLTDLDNHVGGLTFHGAYGTLTGVVPKATLEPYLMVKALPSVTSEEGKVGTETLFTYGFRWTGTLKYGFDYTAELAKQSGSYSNDDIRSWGGYAIAGYTESRIPTKPRVYAQYDYASGDRRLKDGRVGTFDQLYPASHGVFGLVDLLGWRNLRQVRGAVEVTPKRTMKATFDVRTLHLASEYDALYGSTSSVLVKAPKTGALSTDVGKEINASYAYGVRRNMEIGAGYGHLFAGNFLKQNSPGSSTSLGYTFAMYRF